MAIVNLTPHTLNIVDDEGNEIVALPPSGEVARVACNNVGSGNLEEIPTFVTTYGDVSGLPDPEAGKTFIVSGMVEAQVTRPDVYSPGALKRDGAGKPVGCVGLKQT